MTLGNKQKITTISASSTLRTTLILKGGGILGSYPNDGNIVVIYVKGKGTLHMSKIKIARWILLEILFLDF